MLLYYRASGFCKSHDRRVGGGGAKSDMIGWKGKLWCIFKLSHNLEWVSIFTTNAI